MNSKQENSQQTKLNEGVTH